MRLSSVSLAFAAGLLAQAFLSAPAQAAGWPTPDGACCNMPEEAKSTVFDEGKAEEVLPTEARPVPAPTPLDLSAEKLADKESYMDVFRALKDDNQCSRFFGGPNKAVEAFNQFARQLRSKSLGKSGVVIRMSGTYTLYRDALTGASYRLFDKATINSSGPFFSRISTPETRRMQIGRFPVETRQARALMLLHELGHLVEGADGKWLLPNDGNDAEMSDRNTRAVESRCLSELLAIKD